MGTENKHEALIIAGEYEAAARKAKTLRQIQKTLEAMRKLVSGEATPQGDVAPGGRWLAGHQAARNLACHARVLLPERKKSSSLALCGERLICR
jgi:hypothetical protein